MEMNNKKNILIVLVFITTASCSGRFITQMPLLRHHTHIVWSERQFVNSPLNYYLGEDSPGNTIDCRFKCWSDKARYHYVITSASDTIEISFSKAYIQTNTDSINIMINWSTDTSSIYAHPNCYRSIFMGKKCLIKDGPWDDYCSISSTRPVNVSVFDIVNPKKKNRNKTIYDLREEDKWNKLESLIEKMR